MNYYSYLITWLQLHIFDILAVRDGHNEPVLVLQPHDVAIVLEAQSVTTLVLVLQVQFAVYTESYTLSGSSTDPISILL
jgi:hypothetical protein